MGDLTTFPVAPSNLEQNRAWDGGEGDYWASHARQFDEGVAAYHEPLMRSSAIRPEDRVLDIGCGTGQTTRDAARLATEGSALGVDLSGRMLEVASSRAVEEQLTNVSFEQADAQVHPFAPSTFDVAISRTGTMFFGDPTAGFTNVARALRPSGRLVMVAWQPIADNEWFREIVAALAAGRDLPAPPPDAPSPFALSAPERVRTVLTAAGYDDPVFEDLRGPMYFGPTAEDAYRFVLGLQGWMLDGLDEAGRTRARDALLATMTAHQSDGGVQFGSAMWLITATRGG